MITLDSTSLTLNTDGGLYVRPWAQLTQAVLEQGIPHVRGDDWASTAGDLEVLLPFALSSFTDGGMHRLLVDLGEPLDEPCLAAVGFNRGMVKATIAAHSLDVVQRANEWLRLLLPTSAPSAEEVVPVRFWMQCGSGGTSTSRSIGMASWADVRDNYPASVADALDTLMARTEGPERSGQLVLWHGPPGTGKTSALRALAWEWREWCELHYVSDPEALFGSSAEYLMDVLLDEDEDDADRRWRLLVLEDTGELLSFDAKERTGQGLSRLLNVVDGIVGQGLRLLVLVTTNEQVGALHPAVTRPGRCLAALEFPEFSAVEAARWLAARGGAGPAGRGMSLADLYSTLAGAAPAPAARRRIGFVR